MKHVRLFAFALALGSSSLAADTPTASTAAAPTIEPKPGYTIENCVNTLDVSKAQKTKVGYQYWFADVDFAEGNTLKLSVVGVGQATHAPHRHTEDEFFFVIEGHAEFFLDGERRVVGPNTSLYCPSGHEHGIRNAGETELKYLVVKRYPPGKRP
jgi:mannose-6-phosphate isomerase-like protein (cupin superfamily)